MDIETLQAFCHVLPATTEDVKWGSDLCFCIGAKMYCVTGFSPTAGVSFKATEEDFYQLTARDGIIPAPYLARNMWVYVKDKNALTRAEWEQYIRQSYELVRDKLPKKLKKELGV